MDEIIQEILFYVKTFFKKVEYFNISGFYETPYLSNKYIVILFMLHFKKVDKNANYIDEIEN